MKKNLNNIKKSLMSARALQSTKRTLGVDSSQVKNQDIVGDKCEGPHSKSLKYNTTLVEFKGNKSLFNTKNNNLSEENLLNLLYYRNSFTYYRKNKKTSLNYPN